VTPSRPFEEGGDSVAPGRPSLVRGENRLKNGTEIRSLDETRYAVPGPLLFIGKNISVRREVWSRRPSVKGGENDCKSLLRRAQILWKIGREEDKYLRNQHKEYILRFRGRLVLSIKEGTSRKRLKFSFGDSARVTEREPIEVRTIL